jgi:DNA helicase II / ATP-dependent DNA helicase PcrA
VYFADLHVHSKYSMATAKNCGLTELAYWAAMKGIRVVATGDFTHPKWSLDIKDMLEEAEEGLYRLKKEFRPEPVSIPARFDPSDVRFILNVEISSIYKRNNAVRKVHNLVFMPDVDSVERFNARLGRIGNIKSDGRPILGLDSRDLLETALDVNENSFVVPAHVWTPWFSALGSKSGFDSIDECFADLSDHIFALETGLSSDPEMNHLVGSLDKYTLISNSDIHSPSKLGRECNIFSGAPSYTKIRDALRSGPLKNIMSGSAEDGWAAASELDGFIGTLEFFPEEGKYHLDGHRKCSTRLDPHETEKNRGICPECGKPVTVGVLNRVMELATREPGILPEKAAPFWRLVPLIEIIAQIVETAPTSKLVAAAYDTVLKKLGPELEILWAMPLNVIERENSPILAEAIRRVRTGHINAIGGYDGEYGTIEIFEPHELDSLAGQTALFSFENANAKPRRKRTVKKKNHKAVIESPEQENRAFEPNPEQLKALHIADRPVLVQAGPGTGKTGTLVKRIEALIKAGTPSESITAVTFTRKAAEEMRERLVKALDKGARVWIGTFHQLGIRIWEYFADLGLFVIPETVLDDEGIGKLLKAQSGGKKAFSAAILDEIADLKHHLIDITDIQDESLTENYSLYEKILTDAKACDLDDLISTPVRLMQKRPEHAADFARKFIEHLLIDEFQDINKAQYEMVRLLKPDGKGLFAIGDPNQAIYGFRGSDYRFSSQLGADLPQTACVSLKRNYRSSPQIIKAAQSLLGLDEKALQPQRDGTEKVKIARRSSLQDEAMFIMRTIESLIGGTSFFSKDSGLSDHDQRQLGFKDFAILYRLHSVGAELEKYFSDYFLPFQRPVAAKPEDDAEQIDLKADAITMLTMHAAKGLEFAVVFIAGVEDGIVPYLPKHHQIDLDEELRLFYVAMTRAADLLYITYSAKRLIHATWTKSQPSRFLSKLAPSALEYIDPDNRKKKQSYQCDLFGD